MFRRRRDDRNHEVSRIPATVSSTPALCRRRARAGPPIDSRGRRPGVAERFATRGRRLAFISASARSCVASRFGSPAPIYTTKPSAPPVLGAETVLRFGSCTGKMQAVAAEAEARSSWKRSIGRNRLGQRSRYNRPVPNGVPETKATATVPVGQRAAWACAPVCRGRYQPWVACRRTGPHLNCQRPRPPAGPESRSSRAAAVARSTATIFPTSTSSAGQSRGWSPSTKSMD